MTSSTAVRLRPSKSFHQRSALVGEAGQRQHPVADRVAGGLVSGDGQQDEERRHLGGRELLTVDLGLNQAGGQILVRIGAPVLGQCVRVGADFHCDRAELVEVGGQVGIAEAEDDVGPVEDLVVVFGRDAHHVADHLQGQRAGEFGDQLAVAVRVPFDHLRDQPTGAIADRGFDPRNHLRGEGAADDRSQPLMPRVVHRDHRPEVLGQFGASGRRW